MGHMKSGLIAAFMNEAIRVGQKASGATDRELPVREIPNVPSAVEAYYAPDNYHVIAAMEDPVAQKAPDGSSGMLVHVFTDDGTKIWRINDHGRDSCSFFFADQKRIAWTSTRDHMDMPIGNWKFEAQYPCGADLYSSDLQGGNIVRLTNNLVYDAEVAASPDGQWLAFSRSMDGNIGLWRMRPDGSEQQRITAASDWQPGAPLYMPDSRTILFRASRRSEQQRSDWGHMTVFTICHDGTDLKQRTFDHEINWAPYPAPDGRHYVFVKVIEGRNFQIFLGDLSGGAPVRLTYNKGFNGFPSLSNDGRKMLFARKRRDSRLGLHVMDVSSLDIGPDKYIGIPDTPVPRGAILARDFPLLSHTRVP